MQAKKKLNNNAVICTDSTGRELIAMGKGIGFGQLPRDIPLSEIERTFYNVNPQYHRVIPDLPQDVVDFSAKIIDIATNELSYELSPNATFTLADHIAFAIERAQKHVYIRMPLAYDIQQRCPDEYKIGKYVLTRIRKEFHIRLAPEEATGIAMNLMNSRITPENPVEQSDFGRDAKMLEEITEIIENEFRMILNRDSFNYSRYATHLQYLFQRIHKSETINSDNLQMYQSMRDEFPDMAVCVEKISTHIWEEWKCQLSEEEKLYLILHVNRICSKEGL